jgi:hypothetical protein
MSWGSLDPTLWFNLAGVCAAYCPIGAPDPIRARMNVGMNHNLEGSYTAVPGVAPTWNAQTGWGFNGTTQMLNTSIIPGAVGWSALIAVSLIGLGGGSAGRAFCNGNFLTFTVQTSSVWYCNGALLGVPPGVGSVLEVVGFAAKAAYRNGLLVGTIGAGNAEAAEIVIGNSASGVRGLNGRIATFAIYSRTLSAAEVWLASRQMAYCDQNPAWSAWTWKTRTFYSYASLGSVRILPQLATLGGRSTPGISPNRGM